MKYENKHLIIAFTVATIITLSLVWAFSSAETEIAGIELVEKPVVCPVCEVCTVCDCTIAAERLIREIPTIDLTKYQFGTRYKLPNKKNIEIEINGKIYTKEKYDPNNLILNEEILKQK